MGFQRLERQKDDGLNVLTVRSVHPFFCQGVNETRAGVMLLGDLASTIYAKKESRKESPQSYQG